MESREIRYRFEDTLESEECIADPARLLVLLLAIRGAFVLPLAEAMEKNCFRLRADMLKLSVFAGPDTGRNFFSVS